MGRQTSNVVTIEAIEATLPLILALRRANPLTVVPPGYYAEYSKGETQLIESPRNAAGTY